MSVLLKVKRFVSLWLKDKVAVRGRLQYLEVIQVEGKVCPLSKERREDDKHIYSCNVIVFIRYGRKWQGCVA